MEKIRCQHAFLDGVLEEEIYIVKPKGFVVDGKEEKVYRLHKALYGLNRHQELGSSANLIDEFKQAMMQAFERSDLGLMTYFLGMEITQGKD
ncbi:hypothetical protein P3S68_002909 [Capsicum galapagoense]